MGSRALIALVLLLLAAALPVHAQTPNLERGLAITDPEVLDELEKRGLALDALLKSEWQVRTRVAPGSNNALSAMPEMKRVFSSIRAEISATQQANPHSGVGMRFDHKRLFDVGYLSSADARFPLVGIVQRLDRTYKQPETCGEVRLIYRLEYIRQTRSGLARSRLPMTFNLVFKAKSPEEMISCRDIARRWIAAGDATGSPRDIAAALLLDEGALSRVQPRLIDRIETNLQSLRQPATSLSEFGGHAEYVLRVFDWIASARSFQPTAMENMIDRDRLIADLSLLARFKDWLFNPERVRQLDAGTLVVDRNFLDINGRSFAPGGHSRSGNRPSYGLFSNDELLAVIVAADQPVGTLKNISSPAGFEMRLDDIGCVGCHQSRAIGGFHFMGADPAASKKHLAENAIFIPASAHFYGDAPRRRRILEALARGEAPDFARGFSIRPRRSLTRERDTDPRINLIGTGFFNGWGATCYSHSLQDPSFRAWTCAAGLSCVKPHENPDTPGLGVCMTKGRFATGDVAEQGQVRSTGFRRDTYTRLSPLPGRPLRPPHLDITSATQTAAPQAGGFFGGMIYQKSCSGRFPPSTICARHAGTGFNSCLAEAANFKTCFGDRNTSLVGLRECDRSHPCRDDYICVATKDKSSGACLPPYFMMQFRVDGHPPGQ